MFRKLTRAQLVWDIGVAIMLMLAFVPFSSDVSLTGQTSMVQTVASIVVLIVMGGAAAVRRLCPPLALAIAWAGAAILMAFSLVPTIGSVVVPMVLFATAAYGSRRTLWAGLASVGVGSAVATLYLMVVAFSKAREDAFATGAGSAGIVGFVFFVAFVLAACIGVMGLPWTAGLLVRQRRRSRALERDRAVAEALAVVEQQRNQIARDMHDVVAHSLAVVIAQADGARYAAAADPQVATDALHTISTTARGALSDVRLLLTQLRHAQAEGPQPTIAELEELYAQVRAAGVELQVEVDPVPHAEPPGAVQLAVYRILQEALTNALRHGAGATVQVRLAWFADRVGLAVSNPLVGAPSGSAGYGLIGMRERAQLVGGRLDAGPSGNTFVVQATIPIQQEEA